MRQDVFAAIKKVHFYQPPLFVEPFSMFCAITIYQINRAIQDAAAALLLADDW